MKISELIKTLETAKNQFGDIVCLIEVSDDDYFYMMPVTDVLYENREVYGPSVALLE